MKIGDAIQQLLTHGLDAAKQVRLAEMQVNDPTPYVTGPNGERVPVGQQGFSGVVSSVPPVVWIAGLLVVAAVVVLPLLRR